MLEQENQQLAELGFEERLNLGGKNNRKLENIAHDKDLDI